jgi:intercellular adhesin biosynthesis polysaccharide N-deacetylase
VKKKILTLTVLISFIILLGLKIISLLIKDDELLSETYEPIPKGNVCVALTYHRVRDYNLWNSTIEKLTNVKELTVYSVYEEDFEKQMDYLIDSGAYFATLQELNEFKEKGEFPDKCVWISFDDADISVYENAYPILKERKIPFTIFVIAGQVGSKDFKNFEMANWEQLREMRDSGLVSFGSHTYDMHYLEDDQAKFLNKEIYDNFKIDLVKSREVLEKELKVSISSFAYPFGESSDEVVKSVIEAGFKNAFILSPHIIDNSSNEFYQCRYLIDKNNFYKIVVPWLEK